ncbi:MAG TPA: DUF4232 domain-containing protein [Streptosporangiaceae bacterium]|nr:DUF4232 domain-containing protein [Streptosporangiaceae bacterium]
MTSSPRMAGRAVAGSALACFAALVTGCGTGTSPAAAPTKKVTVKATPGGPASAAATMTASAGTSPTSPAATAAPAGAPACPTRSLGAKPGLAQGAAGSTYQVIDFTNISNVTCTLYGFPGVSLAGGKPVTQIGLAAAENHSTPRRLVTLAPGAVANAVLQIVHAANYPAAKCQQVTAGYLQIYPPNQTTPIYLGYTAQACAKPVPLLSISVVQPGSGGGN